MRDLQASAASAEAQRAEWVTCGVATDAALRASAAQSAEASALGAAGEAAFARCAAELEAEATAWGEGDRAVGGLIEAASKESAALGAEASFYFKSFPLLLEVQS